MSKETPLSLVFAERIFGVIMAMIGLILVYNTSTSLSSAGIIAAFPITGGILLILVGLVLLIAKTDNAQGK